MNQLNAVAVVYACKISGASLAVPWKSRSPFSFCCLLVLTAFHCIRIVVNLVQAPWSPAPPRGPGDSGANLSQAALAGRLLVESVPPPLSRPLACSQQARECYTETDNLCL